MSAQKKKSIEHLCFHVKPRSTDFTCKLYASAHTMSNHRINKKCCREGSPMQDFLWVLTECRWRQKNMSSAVHKAKNDVKITSAVAATTLGSNMQSRFVQRMIRKHWNVSKETKITFHTEWRAAWKCSTKTNEAWKCYHMQIEHQRFSSCVVLLTLTTDVICLILNTNLIFTLRPRRIGCITRPFRTLV